MQENLNKTALCEVLKKYIRKNSKDSFTSQIFYDIDFLNEKMKRVKQSFPAVSLHTSAVKANPLVKALEVVSEAGFGAEAASLPEIRLAMEAGIPPDKIVFDSPAKTRDEIEYALRQGIYINADSFAETERIENIIASGCATGDYIYGVRINPQTGAGRILSTSVAGDYSKFGIPLNENREKLKALFLRNDRLRGIHLHTGSQGYDPVMLVEGVKRVYGLAEEVNAELRNNGKPGIKIFDIGGGLPVRYTSLDKTVTVEEYSKRLHDEVPALFSAEFTIITEFGRYLHAPAGWAVSRVEYVKEHKNVITAVIHLGADMFVRECYNPADWHHEIFVTDAEGNIKTGAPGKKPYVIAGPLCFAGDRISEGVYFPEIKEGDYIVIKDIGAYTLSMWSRYNSRQMPEITGYRDSGNSFELLRQKETPQDLVNFWK